MDMDQQTELEEDIRITDSRTRSILFLLRTILYLHPKSKNKLKYIGVPNVCKTLLATLFYPKQPNLLLSACLEAVDCTVLSCLMRCIFIFYFASVMILFFFTQVAPPEVGDNSVTIGVADEHVGLVLGRNGRSIIEISQVCEEVAIFSLVCICTKSLLLLQLSGARIKISDRGDFLSGTSDRYNVLSLLFHLTG